MATRLYNQVDTAFSPFTISATTGTWGSDSFVVYKADPTATAVDDAAYLTRSINTSSSAGTVCHGIYISPPMQSTHAWGSATAIWTVKARENSSTMNVFQMFYWGIISNDGATIQALSSLEKGATEFPVCAVSGSCANSDLFSRTRTDATNGMSYTNIPGDRIYVEVGWDKDGAVSGNVGLQYGYSNTAGDLLGDGDSGVQNSWFEVSENVTFDAEGTVYGSQSRLMLMGVG
jgi:hypothetical protein